MRILAFTLLTMLLMTSMAYAVKRVPPPYGHAIKQGLKQPAVDKLASVEAP